MRHRASALGAWVGLFSFLAALSSCVQVLGDFHGKGTGGAGASSSGTMTGTSTTSSSGTGGAAACAPCTATTDCTQPAGGCTIATCEDECCVTQDVASGTGCNAGGGSRCDGSGHCVACTTAADCPVTGTKCSTPACTAGACVDASATAGTPCTDSDGKACDGMGHCVACQTANDCAPTGTKCASPVCSAAGACTVADATAGTACTDNGTVCDGSGHCVACTMAADCPPSPTKCATAACTSNACAAVPTSKGTPCTDNGGVVCDGSGHCVSQHCTDMVPDADETGPDCGGSCGPCANGLGCKVAADCTSGFCSGTVCLPCASDAQCAAGQYCDMTVPTGSACKAQMPIATACTAGDQCSSGFCSGGVCCDHACNGTCEACTVNLTGQASGTCAPYLQGTPAPAGQCSAGPPCGNDGKCAAGGVCEQTSSTIACGSVSCANAVGKPGMLTPAGLCSGSGTCNAGTATPCPGNVICANGSSCLGGCGAHDATGDASCPSGYYCDGIGAGACQPKQAGGACTSVDQCSSGFCVDGFCCNTACTGVCQGCSAALTGGANGICGVVTNGTTDPRGVCVATPAATCGTDGKCSGGACRDWPSGTACSPSCSNGMQIAAPTCNGSGTCSGAATSCAPYVCGSTACKTSCAGDTDCVAGNFCWLGACVKLTVAAAGGIFSPTDGHTCAVTTAGSVQCWGTNDHGQLGNGSTTDSHVPVPVTGLSSGAVAIAAHGDHTCARTTAGGVLCWGVNDSGELGNNSTTDSSVAVAVAGLSSGVTSIAVGLQHACAVVNGGAQCWGAGGSGQLGNGAAVDSHVPVGVSGLSSGVVAVAAGDFHSCALMAAGGVQCWGYGGYGQLGNNSATSVNTPVAVQGLPSSIASITAGNEHTCAVTTAGAALCWGYNAQGELGNGSTGSVVGLPVSVMNLSSGVAALAAGGLHTCALTTGGAVQCWGGNGYGQIGDGTLTQRLTPVGVTGLGSGVAFVATGEYHTCARTTAGAIQCWGLNGNGQIGNNGTTNSPVPAGVVEP